MSSQLVGKHVQALELHLGIRLLNRTTRRQHLTEAGFAFYERVKIILAEVEAAEGLAAMSGGPPRGRLRINAPVSFGVHALAKRLPEYLASCPEVSVDMSLSNRFVDLIDEGFDVAFRVGSCPTVASLPGRWPPTAEAVCRAGLHRGAPAHRIPRS
jgi:DNA-binding transcriptional LysR family regulator